MNEAELAYYEDPNNRPDELRYSMFYQAADVTETPELQALAGRAVSLLEQDGYTTKEARALIDVHVHAATCISQDCASQEDLMRKVLGPFDTAADGIRGDEGIAVAPFLSKVAPFEFRLDEWLDSMALKTVCWNRMQPALRWLELWSDAIPRDKTYSFLLRLAKLDQPYAGGELALYSRKLADFFAPEPEKLQKLLGHVGMRWAPALLSELGTYHKADIISFLLKDKLLAANGLVRAVKHTDWIAGDCPDLDFYHRSTLGGNPKRQGDKGALTLVYSKDVLLGSIKMKGDKSFIAYVTVADEQGRLPLVKGGVYIPDKETALASRAAYRTQGKWARIQVDRLKVVPLRFMALTGPDYNINIIRALREAALFIDDVQGKFA